MKIKMGRFKNKYMFDSGRRVYFTRILNNFMDEILYQIDFPAVFFIKTNTYRGHPIDMIEGDFAYTNKADLLMSFQYEGLLEKIDRALEKLENGSYGFCEICDNLLPIKSLLSKPTLLRCIRCKKMEIQDH